MSDRLTEALALFDRVVYPLWWHSEMAAAARAFSEGEDIWWCESHSASARPHNEEVFCDRYAELYDEIGAVPAVNCRMVSRRVCPQIEGES